MLTTAVNDLLTRVGPGTPTGDFMRQYWLPVLPSRDLSPDGPPERIRLLGEDLVAWRATDGRVSVMEPGCPHRQAPLFFGRNEQNGLRCVYHGWKFDPEGQCIDMPNEPPESQFAKKVRVQTYPTRERNGFIWTYMGASTPPDLPMFEWNLLPEENVYTSVRIQDCNWLQALEGAIDSSHAPFLHGRIDGQNFLPLSDDLAPRFECVSTDYGVAMAARRDAQESYLYRVNLFLMPFWTMVPALTINEDGPIATPRFARGGSETDLTCIAWVPMDDEHTIVILSSYRLDGPMSRGRLLAYREGYHGRDGGHLSIHSRGERSSTVPYHNYWPKANRENDYLIDWDLQKHEYFSGIPSLWAQDAGTESLLPILDRTKEHLGIADSGIIQTRSALKRAVEQHRDAQINPVSALDPALYNVHAIQMVLQRGTSWIDVAQKHISPPARVNLSPVPVAR